MRTLLIIDEAPDIDRDVLKRLFDMRVPVPEYRATSSHEEHVMARKNFEKRVGL